MKASNKCEVAAEIRRARARAYYAANKEKIKAASASWYAENTEKAKASQRAWRIANIDKFNAGVAAWREANKEKVKSDVAAYHAKNIEKVRRIKRAWKQRNPEIVLSSSRNRRARRLSAGGTHTVEDIKNLINLQKSKCACCKESIDKSYHVDHIMPLALGGSNDRSNIQLLCPKCNLCKSSKHPTDFMQQKGYLL